MLGAVWEMVINNVVSLLPGEARRSYLQVNAVVNPEALERLRCLVEQEKLRVPIDSCWDMSDALQVSKRAGFALVRMSRANIVV